MKKDRFIAIRNQANDSTLELYFLDVIQDTFDWWTGMMRSQVQEIIDKVNYYKPSRIKCVIDSEGGDAFTGMAIYNFLKRCDAKVEVEIVGLAGSIASVIAMAANKGKLRIARNAFMMIHKAEGGIWGTGEELRKGADLVDMVTAQIVDVYSQRTGKSVDEVHALIENGDYWMTGEECVAQGFADETFNDNPQMQVAARISNIDQNLYKNIPAQVRAQLKPEAVEPPTVQNFITNQFTEMKKFFLEIVNAIKGVQPGTKPEDFPQITNKIAEAVTVPFEKLGDEIEKTITDKVGEAATNEEFIEKVTNKVKEGVKPVAIDFATEGVHKTALENAVKIAVENATSAFTKEITDLKKANTDLVSELTVIKGSASQGGNGGNGNEGPKTIGSFK